MEEEQTSCALTGHRKLERDFSQERLKNKLLTLIRKEKINTFYCGMAIGFDLVACQTLIALKEEYPELKIVACIPCPEQSEKFSVYNKKLYDEALALCDERITVSPRYEKGCMHVRNRYMVDRAKFLAAYCNKETGGTASTVRYAMQKNREIVFI